MRVNSRDVELMLNYLLQRIFLFIPTFIGITFIAFLVIHLAPGDPAVIRAGGGLSNASSTGLSQTGQSMVEAALASWRAQYGLDQPILIQYGYWLRNFFTLEFGESFKDNQPV